jgi:hypothetical protein
MSPLLRRGDTKIKIDIQQSKLKEVIQFKFKHEDLLIYRENQQKLTIGLIKYKENETLEMLQAALFCFLNKSITSIKNHKIKNMQLCTSILKKHLQRLNHNIS